jgi:hypothetical protein
VIVTPRVSADKSQTREVTSVDGSKNPAT